MSVQTNLVYVFDLDGVVTDPVDSQVNDQVVTAMGQLLKDGNLLAINTGRSFEWVKEQVLERLSSKYRAYFSHFVIVCEKGGELVTWQDGHWSVEPSEFALPHDLYDIVKETFEQHKDQFDTMFWDSTKRTMATIEKQPAADLDTFHAQQKVLVDKLSGSLTGRQAKIDDTVIATDVESPLAGKHAGADLIYQWVGSFGDPGTHSFISIGDSVSDYEMARSFAEQGAASTFVYVGKHGDKIKHHERVVLVLPKAHFAAGTLEFLANS